MLRVFGSSSGSNTRWKEGEKDHSSKAESGLRRPQPRQLTSASLRYDRWPSIRKVKKARRIDRTNLRFKIKWCRRSQLDGSEQGERKERAWICAGVSIRERISRARFFRRVRIFTSLFLSLGREDHQGVTPYEPSYFDTQGREASMRT